MKQCVLIGCVLLLSLRLQAQDAEGPVVEFHGYVKMLQGASFVDDLDSVSNRSVLQHRINIRYDPITNLSFRLGGRTRVFYGEYVRTVPGFGAYLDQDEGVVDLSLLWVNKRSLAVHSILDRLLADLSLGDLRIILGRQRINWGMTTIWNPNDIFNTYNFLDFDYEERPGTDALRATYHLTPFTSLDIGLAPSKRSQTAIAAGRFTFNTGGYDIQLLGGVCRNELLGGLGFAGSIDDIGLKGEASYFRPNADSAPASATATLMADYTIADNWYVSAAYLFVSEPQGQFFLQQDPGTLSPKSLMPFRNTFYAGVSKAFTPITSAAVGIVYAPAHHSVILLPRIDHSIEESFDVGLVLQTFFGEVEDVFKTQGSFLYFTVRWSY